MTEAGPQSVGAARWSLADVILIDEAADLLNRTPSLGHVIVDEAQDLSAMQLRAVGRRASTGSVTVLGDLAQATTPWATPSWAESLTHLGHPDAEVRGAGRRLPGAGRGDRLRRPAAAAASRRSADAAALGPPAPRRARPAPGGSHALTSLIGATPAGAGPRGHGRRDRARRRRTRRPQRPSERPVSATTCWARTPRSSTPASIWCRPRWPRAWSSTTWCCWSRPTIVAGEPDEVTGLRRLYVCLTRAVTSLVVVHARDLPTALAA